MLLDGFAASWWQGVQSTVLKWEDAVALLRNTFGPVKPRYKVYKELFALEQDLNTPIDVFICKTRVILAQLPKDMISEEIQLNLVYGLLNKKIREKVPRDDVNTFSELLENARLIEEFVDETTSADQPKTFSNKSRCSFCKNMGHTKEECRKLISRKERPLENVSSHPNTPATSASANPPISCYGCGKPGYVRAKCPSCSVRTETSSFEFCEVTTLYKALIARGQKFWSERLHIRLADGSSKPELLSATCVDIRLKGRVIPTTFIVLPGAKNTLLGVDFVAVAKLLISVCNRSWNFTDKPDKKFELLFEDKPRCDTSLELHAISILRCDEGTSLSTEEKRQMCALLEKNKDVLKIIEECESPLAASVVLVPKKDGSMRLCVDYRRLNSITVNDSYLLPRMDDLLHATKPVSYIITIWIYALDIIRYVLAIVTGIKPRLQHYSVRFDI